MNRNITVGQCSGCLEDRTRSGNQANREVVRADDRRIAQSNRGVLDGSAVAQGARTCDQGSVPRDANSGHAAFHSPATVVREIHLAGICALTIRLEIEVAFMPTVIYLVALTLILMRREHGERWPTTRAARRRTCHWTQTTVAVDVETRYYAVAIGHVE